MKRTLIAWVSLVCIGLSSSAIAQKVDEKLIKKLVEEEVQRLLKDEGLIDDAVEQGIIRFIALQKVDEVQELIANIRPVDPARDHILGNPKAKITLIEYSDFECPYCKSFHPELIRLMENNPQKIRWVYRHFPLDSHNPGAQKQAEASECVAELEGNNAFWKYTDLLYFRTKSNGKGFPIEELSPLAEEVGVNVEDFDECMESGRMTARVEEDRDNGLATGISGTPGGFLMNQNGETRFIPGALSIKQLQGMVDELSR